MKYLYIVADRYQQVTVAWKPTVGNPSIMFTTNSKFFVTITHIPHLWNEKKILHCHVYSKTICFIWNILRSLQEMVIVLFYKMQELTLTVPSSQPVQINLLSCENDADLTTSGCGPKEQQSSPVEESQT